MKKWSEEARRAASERIRGDKNPAKRIDVRKKLSEALKGREVPWLEGKKRPEHSILMKKRMLEVWAVDCEERTKHLKAFEKIRTQLQRGHSKLHDEIKIKLEEESIFGFVSEQLIDKFFVDEVNLEKRVVIEIQGDFWHANPSKFKGSDLMPFPGRKILASEVWARDLKRKNTLAELGYTVIQIWESDWKLNQSSQLNKIRESVK